MPSVHSASYDKTVKYDESSRLSGSKDESDSEKLFNIPTVRNISNQTMTMNAYYPENNEQTLTAHELSRETPEFNKSSKGNRGHRFIENRGKFLDTRPAKISSLKKTSSLQQLNSNFSMSGQESENLNYCPADVLLESGNTTFSSVSGKGHALSHKRKFVLLPPTSSTISNSSRKHSARRSKKTISTQSSTTSKVFFTYSLLTFHYYTTLSKYSTNMKLIA